MNILVIEDSEAWQIKLKMMLEELEYKHVKLCSTAEEAREFLDSSTSYPDLIITDIMLKEGLIFDINNTFLLKKPCIFITAAPIQDNYEQTKSFPNAKFLFKPFDSFALFATIDSLGIRPQEEKVEGVFVVGRLKQKILVRYDEIVYLSAEGNYTTIQTVHKKKYVVKKSLISLKLDLDSSFLQIERATIINTRLINRVDFNNNKINISGYSVKIGRTFRASIAGFLNKR